VDLQSQKLLSSSIIEVQELIHEQARLLQQAETFDERDRIEVRLKELWALNKERAKRMSK
jgi:hypothetical protein